MRIRSWSPAAGFILLATTFLLAGFSTAGGQTTTQAPAKPKTAQRTDASPKASGKQGGMTARGAQRGQFTQNDKDTFEKETRSAIIVAPSYRDSGLATLRFTFADAVELKSELERQGYTVRVIPSTEATSDGIRQTLANQKTFLEGTNQATLLFAFMGHGFQDGRGQNYLMTYGADPNNMDKEALSVEEVQTLMTTAAPAARSSSSMPAAMYPAREMLKRHAPWLTSRLPREWPFCWLPNRAHTAMRIPIFLTVFSRISCSMDCAERRRVRMVSSRSTT